VLSLCGQYNATTSLLDHLNDTDSSQSESGEMGFRPLLLSAMLLVYEDVVVASASSSSSVAAAGGFDFAVTGKPVMFSR